MSDFETLRVMHNGLEAVVQFNGRKNVDLYLYRDPRDADARPVTPPHSFNPADARARGKVLAELPDDLRDDADALLVLVAEQVGQARAAKADAKRKQQERRRQREEQRAAVFAEADAERQQSPEFSDDALSLEFTRQFGADLRYTEEWHRWHRWDGSYWTEDKTLAVMDLAREICRRVAATAPTPKLAGALASAKAVAAVERLAKAHRAHATAATQWDADPMLLNTPGEVIDLRTGTGRAPRRADYCTKTAAVARGGSCPLWLEFLKWATDGDVQLQRFLQRMAGYCLTGDIREHALFFCYGTGGNGKGTLLNTISRICGGYWELAAIETFTASTTDRHPTELAKLRGARLVTAQETERGRRWAESRIKALTGGDPITARFMRADFFTYEPQFKLVIAGNHKPHLRDVDEAIRRRFHLIPFLQKITAEKKDAELPDKLRAEWPGILAWMVDGCQMWLEEGLRPPECVTDSTREYLDAEDSVQAWLDECCAKSALAKSSSAELFNSWRTWAERAGEAPGSAKALTAALQGKGYERTRLHGGTRGIAGIAVKADTANAYAGAQRGG